VFGKRAGESAAKFAKERGAGQIRADQVERANKTLLAPFERGAAGAGGPEGPYKVQYDLQDMMQDKVGIVRNEKDMRAALEGIEGLKQRATKVGVGGNREYNPGWHTALDLPNLLICSEAVARSALERKESRGGHFREDFEQKDPAFATFNIVCRKAPDGTMQIQRRPIPDMPPALKQIVEENK
jgi:succinate dehydrogenase / fumarate reductase flavoprotein subunit